MDKLKPTNDYVFKQLLLRKNNALIDLVESILGIEIKSIVIQKDYALNKTNLKNKLGILDILAKLNDDTLLNIEMQVVNHKDMIDRTIYYGSALMHDALNSGEEYIESKKVIEIAILDFELEGIEAAHEVCRIRRDSDLEILSSKLEFHYIQIPKALKEDTRENRRLKNWINFISQNEEGVKKAMEENEIIKEAQEELEILNENEEVRYFSSKRDAELRQKAVLVGLARREREEGIKEGKEKGIKEGKEKGIKEGIKQNKIEIAKRMLLANIDIETIIKITNLTEEEIKNIKIK